LPVPRVDLTPVQVAAPLTLPGRSSGSGASTTVMSVLMPLVGGGVMVASLAARGNTVMRIGAVCLFAVMLLGAVAMAIHRNSGKNKELQQQRQRYSEHIAEVREVIRTARAEQRRVAEHVHPEPLALVDLVHTTERRWERNRNATDFLLPRVGLGTDELWRPVEVGSVGTQLVNPDPITQAEAAVVTGRLAELPNMPVAVPWHGAVSVVGLPENARAALRAMVAQVVALHAPNEVQLAWAIGRSAIGEFDWVKWLPHTLDSSQWDGSVPRRLVADSAVGIVNVLRSDLDRRVNQASTRGFGQSATVRGPHLVIITDHASAGGADVLPDGSDVSLQDIKVTQVALVPDRRQEPAHVDVRVTVDGDAVTVEDLRPRPGPTDPGHAAQLEQRRLSGAREGTLDHVSIPVITKLAREVSPYRLVEDANQALSADTGGDLRALLGIADEATFDVQRAWAPRRPGDFLKVPFAVGQSGRPIHLDLKQAPEGGVGPHGLCVGATGSGKSEFLRTLVLALAMTHPPERLNLVLVDYKGGATFSGLGELPHTSAMVTNLSDDVGLVDRLHDAVQGEITRRQRILAEADADDFVDYDKKRAAGAELDPVPYLFIVIDEFGELLTAKQDFIELFLQIGRIGRSLGMHMLLASQRLEEGKIKGLETYLSYRIGLRTFNEQESRTVLGVPDAYHLPSAPGNGYLSADQGLSERWKALYVSGNYEAPSGVESVEETPRIAPFTPYNEAQNWLNQNAHLQSRTFKIDQEKRTATVPSVLDVVVQRLAQQPTGRARQVWLPPLPNAMALSDAIGRVEPDSAYGLTAADGRWHGTLALPMGTIDIPAEQRQEPLVADLAAGSGHLAVLGSPQSGKSTALRTLILSAALTHTPGDLAFYCVDFGGGGLNALAGMPNVSGVADRMAPERVRRTISEVATLLGERERVFAEHRLDSVRAMREQHRAGKLPELDSADICLVVDGYSALRNDFEDLVDTLHDIASRGAGYGVHVVVTAGRWADLRMQVQSVIGHKLELRLNDPLDTAVKRNLAENLKIPGRCLTDERLTGHIALPRIDGHSDPATLAAGVQHAVDEVVRHWNGPTAAPVRMLPDRLDYRSFAERAPDRKLLRLGVDETELRPTAVDLFGEDPHLLVFGDTQTGKTSLLRLVVEDFTARYGSDEVVFALFDPRRSMLDCIADDYLGGYAHNTSVAAGLAHGMSEELAKRLPPEDVTVEQLRNRSWWRGPEIVALVDDYDLLSSGSAGSPLAPFQPYLQQSRDIGFHVVLCRRSTGSSRALFEPFVQGIKEAGAAGLLLSGERSEGQMWPGAYFSQQPPGRGTLVRRGRKPRLVQTAYVPRNEEAAAPSGATQQ
jgi:S-DNA-T family DNA segregation ATPase FtsK/SpoIIIE